MTAAPRLGDEGLTNGATAASAAPLTVERLADDLRHRVFPAPAPCGLAPRIGAEVEITYDVV